MLAAAGRLRPRSDVCFADRRLKACSRDPPLIPHTFASQRPANPGRRFELRRRLWTRLPGADLVETLRERLRLRDQLLACVLLLPRALGLECPTEMRLELGPPAEIQHRPCLRTQWGARFRQVTCIDQGPVEPLRVTPVEQAQKVEDPLLRDGVIAREPLERQHALPAGDLVEKECGCQ